jgi:hypothetical protein
MRGIIIDISIASTREIEMTYQIAISEAGIFVVLTSGSKIIRIVRKCDDRSDAAQVLRDLTGWSF